MSDLLNNLHSLHSESPDWVAEDAKAAEAIAKPEEKPAEAAEAEAVAEEPGTQEAAAEAPEAQEQAPEPEDKVQRVVPLKALQEERQKRTELERRLAELEKWASQDNEPKLPADEAPDPETDPIGALKYERARRVAIEQAQHLEYQKKRLANIYQDSARSFAQETPDFKDAYAHTINSRAMQLRALGYENDKISDMIQAEEMNLVDTALQRGQNPAAVIYEYAKSYGYAGPKPAAAPPAKVDPVAAVEQQAKKQAAATSMTAGGKAPKSDFDPKDLASLSGAAFDSAWDKMARLANPRSSMFRN